MTDEPVYFFQKNTSETVYATVGEYKGRSVVSLRAYYTDSEGNEQPTQKGLTVGVDKVDELVNAALTLKEAVTVDRITDDQIQGKTTEELLDDLADLEGPSL